MQEPTQWAIAILAALFIGISKAGFGGGLGMLTTPLCVLAFGPKDAIGILLPLLCAGDLFSMYHYWGRWDRRNLRYLLPGVVVGVFLGVQLIDQSNPRQLNLAIGILAVSFVSFQVVKDRIFRAEGAFQPNHRLGIPFGIGTGISSTFAHGAGPVVSMFLIPQRMPKTLYVGTTVLIFTWVNWIKLPFYCVDQASLGWTWLPKSSIINGSTLQRSALFLPLIPVGVWLGIWLNRKIPEDKFIGIIYILVFATGLQLIFGFDFAAWFTHA